MPLLEVKNLKVHFPVKHGMFMRRCPSKRRTAFCG